MIVSNVCPSVVRAVRQTLCLRLCLCLSVSLCLFPSLSLFLSSFLSVCLCLCLFVSVSVSLCFLSFFSLSHSLSSCLTETRVGLCFFRLEMFIYMNVFR